MIKPFEEDSPPEPRLSRRGFLSLGAGAFVLLALPAVPWRRGRAVRRSVPVMGTIADIVVVDPDERRAQAAIEAAVRELQWVDRTMSRFSPTSDVGRANTSAAGDAVEVTVPTARVLGEAIRWAEASDGRFDPCLGRATALWNFEERPRLPDARQIERVAGERAYRELEIGRSGARHTVRLRSDQVAIDLGGIAKGYGVDRAIAALRKGGISNGLVNAGGDLYALGRSEQGNEWTIGVRDPARPATLAATLKMSDRGVATSGDYFQYFDHEGRRYHHLLDPATGGPRETRMHSVTVAAATCMAADAAATTVFGLGPDVGQKLLRRTEPGARIVHSA